MIRTEPLTQRVVTPMANTGASTSASTLRAAANENRCAITTRPDASQNRP